MRVFSDYFRRQAQGIEEFGIRDGRLYGSPEKNPSLRYYMNKGGATGTACFLRILT